MLDAPGPEAVQDLDLLTRMRVPGALELLAAYEKLAPEARSALVTFLRTISADAEVKRPTARVA